MSPHKSTYYTEVHQYKLSAATFISNTTILRGYASSKKQLQYDKGDSGDSCDNLPPKHGVAKANGARPPGKRAEAAYKVIGYVLYVATDCVREGGQTKGLRFFRAQLSSIDGITYVCLWDLFVREEADRRIQGLLAKAGVIGTSRAHSQSLRLGSQSQCQRSSNAVTYSASGALSWPSWRSSEKTIGYVTTDLSDDCSGTPH